MTLTTSLTDWTDIDIAAHEVARGLGILPGHSTVADGKAWFWSDNPLGNELFALLDRLTTLGFLEKRNEPDLQYRVAPQFRARLGIEDLWQRLSACSPVSLKLVVLRCADLARSREFFEALGLVLTLEQHGSGPQHYSAQLGETVLELYPASGPAVPTRIGIEVPDIQATIAAVAALGNYDYVVRFEPEREPSAALLRDPDGNKIHVSSRSHQR
ncbi:MAG TPA: VOC family protein [Polyangiaceae bacterium]|nr:VOC family protein [Polyangiaceae bacterium]